MWASVRTTAQHLLELPAPSVCCRRWLNLHEHQAKSLLQDAGVHVQRFFVAHTVEETQQALDTFDASEYVIKAQILAGGRGKGRFSGDPELGGVKFTSDKQEVVSLVGRMLNQRLVTKQTGDKGALVKQVMVAESIPVLKRECYLAVLLDRTQASPMLVASSEGGVDIETTARTNPEKIIKEAVNVETGLTREQSSSIADRLQFTGQLKTQLCDQLHRLYDLFGKVDATQIEINPLCETDVDGLEVCCVDAKFNFDDNARYRQTAIFALADNSDRDAREVEAETHGVNYISLDGNIACLVNGAGLAMATMDTIKLHGGEPANFLDIGGSVTEAAVINAFQIIASDNRAQSILVNIFGGIVNCALVARGIAQAVNVVDIHVPVVVRLNGTAAEEAREILKNVPAELHIISASDLDDAAAKAVAAAGQRKS